MGTLRVIGTSTVNLYHAIQVGPSCQLWCCPVTDELEPLALLADG